MVECNNFQGIFIDIDDVNSYLLLFPILLTISGSINLGLYDDHFSPISHARISKVMYAYDSV